MFHHIGMLTLSETATDADRAAIGEGLRGLLGVIPELRAVAVADDLGLTPGNASVIFQMTFDDEEGWRAYAVHPAHKAVVAERIGPVLAAKSFVQTAGFVEASA